IPGTGRAWHFARAGPRRGQDGDTGGEAYVAASLPRAGSGQLPRLGRSPARADRPRAHNRLLGRSRPVHSAKLRRAFLRAGGASCRGLRPLAAARSARCARRALEPLLRHAGRVMDIQRSPDDTPARYQIQVRGTLDPRWSAWFDQLAISYDAEGNTLLAGPVI